MCLCECRIAFDFLFGSEGQSLGGFFHVPVRHVICQTVSLFSGLKPPMKWGFAWDKRGVVKGI